MSFVTTSPKLSLFSQYIPQITFRAYKGQIMAFCQSVQTNFFFVHNCNYPKITSNVSHLIICFLITHPSKQVHLGYVKFSFFTFVHLYSSSNLLLVVARFLKLYQLFSVKFLLAIMCKQCLCHGFIHPLPKWG